MSRRLIVVVSDPADMPGLPADRMVTADRYLAGTEAVSRGGAVINLCRSYRYRTKGYYVSLVADARGQRVLPSVETIEGLTEPFGLFRVLREAGVPTMHVVKTRPRRRDLPSTVAAEEDSPGPDAHPSLLVVSTAEPVQLRPARDAEPIEALAYFGQCADNRFRAAAQAIYREWPAPILRIQLLEEEGEWKVSYAAAVPVQQLAPADRNALVEGLQNERWVLRRATPTPAELKRASLAVLYDETDPFSPSTPETIDRLSRIAAKMNVHVHRIGLDEIDRLGDYDALFIRTLTGVREPSFQFALRAEALDMPVIDDPQSIIRCSNKVFLDELLRREGIATPRTRVVTSQTPWSEVEALGCPVVVKLPDGSFSAAVHKCMDRAEYERVCADMFRRSPLLIAQEFLPTDYDWRITVLGGKVLFAAKYHMARGHWQIRNVDPGGERYGKVDAVPREETPRAVAELGLRAAALIGNGLYGVDIKETPTGPVVIEVNDNPNLDIGYDDAADGNVIYEDVLAYFVRRIEETPPAEEAEEARAPTRAPAPPAAPTKREFRPFEVAGIELEYAVVDRDLNAVSLVEDAFRSMTGRATSDVDLGRCSFSNEIADHVFELKTPEPTRRLRDAEDALMEGVTRFSSVLRNEFGARLLPTGMHPWLNPKKAKLWTRSNSRIYQTYSRLFDVHTHGWMNVHATHLNLPLGRDEEAVAMYNASALLIPYLPALAASSPMYDGELQSSVDNRLAWIVEHQARIPESCGDIVPEYVEGLGDYRKRILGGMYRALDELPGAGILRHEFFNARGAVLKFSRRAMEIRVLDTQECVKLDIAISVFVRSALRYLAHRAMAGKLAFPDHHQLVHDFRATIRDGSQARVLAPHLGDSPDRGDNGLVPVQTVLHDLLRHARKVVRREDADYLDLVETMIESGSLSERIRSHLMLYVDDDDVFTEAARRVYIELADCLDSNEPWWGRGL
ncbi:MAG: RimK-like ATPgrasp N-terminal domain-containing protein [Gemmatimonadetes bacterium]|nr:RimK-like ATPgrasp N-terminal domain-containing protein [Gemmatimonadota bacterium]